MLKEPELSSALAGAEKNISVIEKINNSRHTSAGKDDVDILIISYTGIIVAIAVELTRLPEKMN